MLERWITALSTEDPGLEESATTRERLKTRFPRNATRRMTQLGLLVGAALEPLAPVETDTLVYASGYAESRALEDYLDSFPSASPTLFQTSIHPSAVQQALIIRQQSIRQFFPLTGGDYLPAQALQVALLADTPRAILCGGEERGTWLLAQNAASDRTFAFALALSTSPDNALARVTLNAVADGATGSLTLPGFFDTLHARRPFDGFVAPARRLMIEWL
ncbi:MAG: hypothetical protein WC205_03960 [Opitutaceae bacterium]|jgi:hypothetical protein